MKKTILIALLGMGIFFYASGGKTPHPQNNLVSEKGSSFMADLQQKKDSSMMTKYTCSMHPEVIQDKPGKCPKCGMNLITKEVKKSVYTCPMHPEITRDKPGKCPKCGMNLDLKEPVKKAASPKK